MLRLTVMFLGGLLSFYSPIGASDAEERQASRVDQFDERGRRTGYLVVDPKTGRVDRFDALSRRTGSGQIQGTHPEAFQGPRRVR